MACLEGDPMSADIFYIPIICCLQPMTEIYDRDGKRIAAYCEKCKKAWRPPQDTTPKIITIGYRVKL
jgi:hypothetical protein